MFDHQSTCTPPAAASKSQTEPESQHNEPVGTDVLARRRALLKAAASAAPLIATLPGGEALANSSLLQCVINQQMGADEAPKSIRELTDPLDTYSREDGFLDFYLAPDPRQPPGTTLTVLLRVYRIREMPPGAGWLSVYADLNLPEFPPLGSWFQTGQMGYTLLGSVERQFLRAYGTARAPIQAPTDVAINFPLPGGCNFDVTWPGPAGGTPDGPQEPQHCFYPLAVQSVQGASNNAGNVPLAASCLASFDRG
jgi:hypothetical protein